MKYGQFCPIAKASEVLGERWTLLVVRELMSGATRYRDLQRGLGRISPSVLSSRIKTLLEHGIVERVQSDSEHGWEYRLTRAGTELAPIIESIGGWGQRWVRSRMTRDELDVELLMLTVERNFDASAFPKDHAVIAFVFSDLQGPMRRWWLLLDDGHTELCSQPPGRHRRLHAHLQAPYAGGGLYRRHHDPAVTRSATLGDQGSPPSLFEACPVGYAFRALRGILAMQFRFVVMDLIKGLAGQPETIPARRLVRVGRIIQEVVAPSGHYPI